MMGWIFCSVCGRNYNTLRGGCTNPACRAADKAQVARLRNAPKPPSSKVQLDTLAKEKSASLLSPKRSVSSSTSSPPVLVTQVSPPPPVRPPVPIVVSNRERSPDPDHEDSEAGRYILYRGDTRSPSQLANGFQAWVPVSAEVARSIIRKGAGALLDNTPIRLPSAASRHEEGLGKRYNLLTLGRQIKQEKAGDTYHISTDPSEDCGGYTSGNIYAMQFDGLHLLDKTLKPSKKALNQVLPLNPLVLINQPTLTNATTIALVIGGGAGPEVAFLTSIPRQHICKYKSPKDQSWTRFR
ncbi:MAG: hypothetical protein HN742_03740 [Lentisphaerae bacterium]|mgnify:CR=1 FL=1|jgi:hypothetical protein|nr:hypothetical protein [Lentisphaerota bacterium]MBT4814750.1 hypothetical protein [Lentisphaerota bacterium]MBT5605778.1 hypothetical protein [Lentisphaerota bacterium]MBT7055845.1 hypothetical protein [Lentisphaerota bacterium]MBT7840954.1 hypothetical protein [Lentisphaerota bacterium]